MPDEIVDTQARYRALAIQLASKYHHVSSDNVPEKRLLRLMYWIREHGANAVLERICHNKIPMPRIIHSLRNVTLTKLKHNPDLPLSSLPVHVQKEVLDKNFTENLMSDLAINLLIQSLMTDTEVPQNINQSNFGDTPLHIAAQINSDAAIHTLIAANANIKAKNLTGDTPMHLAAAKNSYVAIKALIDSGADFTIKNNSGETPLHVAVRNNKLDAIEILIANKADANLTSEEGLTPLIIAIRYNCLAAIELLINAGADVNKSDSNANSPLHWAAAYEHTAIPLLLAAGADINARANDQSTPLHVAAHHQSYDAINALLAWNNTSLTSNSSSANWYSIATNSLPPLLDPDKTSSNSFIPMLELSDTAKRRININAKDRRGYTPLHCAVPYFWLKHADKRIVTALKKAGADPQAKDNNNRTMDDLIKINRNDKLYDNLYSYFVFFSDISKAIFFLAACGGIIYLSINLFVDVGMGIALEDQIKANNDLDTQNPTFLLDNTAPDTALKKPFSFLAELYHQNPCHNYKLSVIENTRPMAL